MLGQDTEPGHAIERWRASTRDFGRCTALRHGQTSLFTALLANGAVGNVLEMDDIHRTAIIHPGPVVVPAALASAEHVGADGVALLDAIARGYEAMIRVGQALGPGHYKFWHNTATCGPLGAAAAAGSLFNLSIDQQVDALGNAGTQAAGLWQVRLEPGMGKQLHNGRAAHAGVLAADLARCGFTGASKILEGPLGFFAAMCPDGDIDRVLADPDDEWKLFDTGFKPWPACRHTHPTIDATLALRDSVDLDAIDVIEVHTFRDAVGICDRVHPTTTVESKFSLQHAVAVVLLEGTPTLAHFTAEAATGPRYRGLRERVRPMVSEPYAANFPSRYGAKVSVYLRDGRTIEAQALDALGDPGNPLSIEGIVAKAHTLLAAAGIAPTRASAIVDATLALPRGASLTQLGLLLQ